MNVLFIHQNFPGQFIHLAAKLAGDKRNKVAALSIYDAPAPPGVMVRRYTMLRPAAPETHPMLQDQEAKILRAEACAAAAFQLKREGFVPDVIVAHPGWGEALFIKDVFPQAKLVLYCEYYYALEGQDVGFDPEFGTPNFEQKCRLRLKNTTNLLSMELADVAYSPTSWQKSTYPIWAQDKIQVVHDGIDMARFKFSPEARLSLRNGQGQPLTLKPGDEVLTYVARNLEPVRGFHILMRTLPEVMRRRPRAQIVVVGGNEVSYGSHAPGGLSWKQRMLNEVGGELDLNRLHFVGKLAYAAYLQLLSISRVHAYWTTPFVLSWSLLECAASGLPVVASRTPPVSEFAAALGLHTAEFFDHADYADKLAGHLERGPLPRVQPASFPAELRLAHCLQLQIDLLASV